MNPYKYPTDKCEGELHHLEFNEPMVHRQRIHLRTGEIVADIEESEEEAPFFRCVKCGQELHTDDFDTEKDIFDQWFTLSLELKDAFKKKQQKDKEARQEKARQRKKAGLETKREEYLKDTGFLPPMSKKK